MLPDRGFRRRQASPGSSLYVAGSTKDRFFLFDPFGASGSFEFFRENFIDLPQMRHVGERIFQLASGQRAPAPVREASRLVDIRLCKLANERFIGRRLAKTADHRRDLRIKKRGWNHSAKMVENFNVLSRGVENLDDSRIGEKPVKGREINSRRQRVNNRLRVRSGRLNQTQLGPVRLIPHEFGIDGGVGTLFQFDGEFLEVRRRW